MRSAAETRSAFCNFDCAVDFDAANAPGINRYKVVNSQGNFAVAVEHILVLAGGGCCATADVKAEAVEADRSDIGLAA